MNDTLRISVILPTYNRQDYLADAIRSVLAQTVPALDFVVVDDGSTDATPDVAARFAADVTYVRQPNAGKLAAIAAGLDRTRGELVWIMDDDDLATPDALQNLSEPFVHDPDLVLTYGRMTRFDDDDPAATERLVEYPDDSRPFLVQLMEDCFVTGHPCVLVRRSALQRLRPFDPGVIASVDYYLHLGVAQTGRADFVDRVVLRQRQHRGLRGPAHHRYREDERIARWVAHDADLLKPMLAALPLQAYIAPPPWTGGRLKPAQKRLALIQQAVIAGRKTLWPKATTALRAALRIMPDAALSDQELRVLQGMLGSRYGIGTLNQAPGVLIDLHAACAPRSDRTEALIALSRPLLHQIKIARRERSPMRAARAIKCWARLMDVRATRAALQSALGRNLTRAAARMR